MVITGMHRTRRTCSSRKKFGVEEDISVIHQSKSLQFQEARKVINDTNNEREDLEKQIRKLMDELAEYRRKYVLLNVLKEQ